MRQRHAFPTHPHLGLRHQGSSITQYAAKRGQIGAHVCSLVVTSVALQVDAVRLDYSMGDDAEKPVGSSAVHDW